MQIARYIIALGIVLGAQGAGCGRDASEQESGSTLPTPQLQVGSGQAGRGGMEATHVASPGGHAQGSVFAPSGALRSGGTVANPGVSGSSSPEGETGTSSPVAGTGMRANEQASQPQPAVSLGATPASTGPCQPDAGQFELEVGPILASRCGGCHGEQADFGAPFSLTDYASIVAGDPGTRISDRMITALADGTMPPPGNLRPPPPEHETLVRWASCGQRAVEYPTGLVSSRPLFEASATPPADADVLELRATDFAVAAGTRDHYEDFFFDTLVEDDAFVHRIDVVVDNTRVVHHVALHYDDPNETYLYAWAPGTGAIEFPGGGLRIDRDTVLRLGIHYNNLTDHDEVDTSGVRMWVIPPEGKEYVMLDPATFDIRVPPDSTATAEATCIAANDFTIVAGMPHMHEIGDTFVHTITRADTGETETLIELEGWSFDLQFIYAMPMEVRAGDTMTIRCSYVNNQDRTVRGGFGTINEMCYDFLYVTPGDASVPCGNGFGNGTEYDPGFF